MSVQLMNSLTWKEIADLDRENTFCVIPISSLEQHGYHLPVGADDFILEYSLESLVKMHLESERNVLILPSIKYGNSLEHLSFPGTVTLKTKTIISIIEDIVESLSVNGFKNIICLNSHGGNTSILHAVAQDFRYKYGVKILNIDLWASNFFEDADEFIKTNFVTDVHAGEIETSLLMYTNPDLVKEKSCSCDELSNIVNFSEFDFSWLSKDISRCGVIGDATDSCMKTGKRIANYIDVKIEKIFNSILKIF